MPWFSNLVHIYCNAFQSSMSTLHEKQERSRKDCQRKRDSGVHVETDNCWGQWNTIRTSLLRCWATHECQLGLWLARGGVQVHKSEKKESVNSILR
jgi:hypothetical protein